MYCKFWHTDFGTQNKMWKLIFFIKTLWNFFFTFVSVLQKKNQKTMAFKLYVLNSYSLFLKSSKMVSLCLNSPIWNTAIVLKINFPKASRQKWCSRFKSWNKIQSVHFNTLYSSIFKWCTREETSSGHNFWMFESVQDIAVTALVFICSKLK